MSYKLRLSAKARRHIRAAADWWLANRSKAPEAFADDLEDAFLLISSFPAVGQRVPHTRLPQLRRPYLARVRYHLYYVASDETETVEILALWHASRGEVPSLP